MILPKDKIISYFDLSYHIVVKYIKKYIHGNRKDKWNMIKKNHPTFILGRTVL